MESQLSFVGFDPEEYLPQVSMPNTEHKVRAMLLDGAPLVMNYGGGVNSTAMTILALERGFKPTWVLFADTGDEHDWTMEYLGVFGKWLEHRHGQCITTCRYDSRHKTLEGECLNNGTLPSLAFGFRGCSAKWKRAPMDMFLKAQPECHAAWETGTKVIRCIGIHADESHRGIVPGTRGFAYWRPLVEWGIGQDDCARIIQKEGLPVPRKSSCWHCPAKKKREVIELATTHPNLFARAVAMERNARNAGGLKSIEGLGRHWSWEGLVAADEAQRRLFADTEDQACIWCDDGSCGVELGR